MSLGQPPKAPLKQLVDYTGYKSASNLANYYLDLNKNANV